MTAYIERADYTSWGRVSRPVQQVARPRFRDEVIDLVADRSGTAGLLAVGMRRSYGESGLNPGKRVIDMTGLDRIIAFDRATGVLRAEAGATLRQLAPIVMASGWFFATTPGTSHVTLGGAVANDVHGKNHHSAGSLGCSVRALTLARSDGSVQRLVPGDALFAPTIGGLGLTGALLDVELQLVRVGSAFLDVERLGFDSIGAFFELVEASSGFEHTVAWVDCLAGGAGLGRGVLQRANWRADGDFAAPPQRGTRSLPIDLPGFVLNRQSIGAFNALYRWVQLQGPASRREHYRQTFYPLDAIAGWNRMYGARGFYQYQCVLPTAAAPEALVRLLETIAAAGQGSFLAVLKTFGPRQSGGLLSFPMEGATLALDFANRGEATLELLARLDRIVERAGGRLYAAKDGRMPASMFQSGYPRWREMAEFRDERFTSAFWERVTA